MDNASVEIDREPFAGDGGTRDRVEASASGRDGLRMHDERLERGTFERIDANAMRIEIDRARMSTILEGSDTKTLDEIGEDVTEELERLVIAVVHEIARAEYACGSCA